MNTNKKWSPSTSSMSDRWIKHFSFYLSNTSTFSVDLILCHLSLESPIAPPLIDHPPDHFILLWFLVHCITETAVSMQIQWCPFLFLCFHSPSQYYFSQSVIPTWKHLLLLFFDAMYSVLLLPHWLFLGSFH